jgi:transposase-like protein
MGDLIQLSHRPKTRADCANGIRPCPFITCRYNLRTERVAKSAADGKKDSQIIREQIEPRGESCALDVAESQQGFVGATYRDIAKWTGLTMEGARKTFIRACERIGADPDWLMDAENSRREAMGKAIGDGANIAHVAAAWGVSEGSAQKHANERGYTAARQYSENFRRKVAAHAAEHGDQPAADKYGVSLSTAARWRRSTHGPRKPTGKRGRAKGSGKHPMPEIAAFAREHSVSDAMSKFGCARSTVYKAMKGHR